MIYGTLLDTYRACICVYSCLPSVRLGQTWQYDATFGTHFGPFRRRISVVMRVDEPIVPRLLSSDEKESFGLSLTE
jgi:hypothetical protein